MDEVQDVRKVQIVGKEIIEQREEKGKAKVEAANGISDLCLVERIEQKERVISGLYLILSYSL